MTAKPRSTGQTAISISLPNETLAWIDEQRSKLNLGRSAYIRLAIDRKTAKSILMTAEECNDADEYKTKNERGEK